MHLYEGLLHGSSGFLVLGTEMGMGMGSRAGCNSLKVYMERYMYLVLRVGGEESRRAISEEVVEVIVPD